MEEGHGVLRMTCNVIQGSVDCVIINVEDDMFTTEGFPPTEDGVDHSIHLLDLDVSSPILPWSACREPLTAHDASKAFHAAGIGVDMNDVALW